ncbi:hypothetical protein AVEN_209520-1 [Araneus ventricosus]|uniref:Uncharacterized protein n=1 Tax=Araneus ventricosus TaxID=182803 RepID=A0A4Y2IMU3_ARAVE|nr:hypothetical protein AVEN_209520-1 [Araneus ventricosus]
MMKSPQTALTTHTEPACQNCLKALNGPVERISKTPVDKATSKKQNPRSQSDLRRTKQGSTGSRKRRPEAVPYPSSQRQGWEPVTESATAPRNEPPRPFQRSNNYKNTGWKRCRKLKRLNKIE